MGESILMETTDVNRKDYYTGVCSAQIAHAAADGSLLWMNGGLNRDKRSRNSPHVDFNYYVEELGEKSDYYRTNKPSHNEWCQKIVGNRIFQLSDEEKSVLKYGVDNLEK